MRNLLHLEHPLLCVSTICSPVLAQMVLCFMAIAFKSILLGERGVISILSGFIPGRRVLNPWNVLVASH